MEPGRGWSADHLRLHRHLRSHPSLLPPGAPLLVAVSGGQDSMALIGLLHDLRRRHGWSLHLWHGDHGWRPESRDQAAALALWAIGRGLPLLGERADPPPAGEDAARRWRYGRLAEAARSLGCGHVVTGHTADDRAETVLLHLARGSHRQGLSSLRASRPLAEIPGAPHLCRPLLPFSRSDTLRICRQLDLPIWEDASNGDPRFSRNRVRAEVLPVLETLHPGAARRIAAQAERLAEEEDDQEELLQLTLTALALPATAAGMEQLRRAPLAALSRANRRRLLQRWLRERLGRPLNAAVLDALAARLETGGAPGRLALPDGWRLAWDRGTLFLMGPDHADG
ncbi:tRNA lysidine(34) synthetase TilS [Cyanobium sp. FGCU-52]|nr:tRNA lysidine(34) synthetase TilS [Cyanobium sp. FGCU52]